VGVRKEVRKGGRAMGRGDEKRVGGILDSSGAVWGRWGVSARELGSASLGPGGGGGVVGFVIYERKGKPG